MDKNRIEEEMDWSIQQVAKLAGTTSRTGANGYRYYDAPTLARLQRIFDHTAYKQEVESRWGADAYAAGDTWWRSMSADERDAWKLRLQALNADWTDAAARGLAPDSDAAQELAARHYAWLRDIPGTPREGSVLAPDYVRGLGEMYVTDERFAANYGGVAGATLVRDALALWLDRNVH